ncbi:hypothetical protein ACU8C9_001362 [Campylobacter jejuni]|uniref:Bacteriocin-type signal sequence domain-containing protein n=2 Tax=Campylobacter TaxID=194 RepID=A0A5T1VXI3_CAMJU|nr:MULTISPECIES: hypothetical protein [Campylobacter]EAH4564012.1 hypothetical protein [Campylobacter jejuni]EAH4582105.1 hypothetical protein [Campylobacter jejuni]EAH4872127.1 hypothetical protein [Campylobacter jejuni]EAH5070039.1 hypothetical protein [Campylobacter jejuni]EAH5182559.1 hypothetical protein [Campylobacter jejuni]
MKKIFALLALTSLLTSSVFAEDFLAKLTKGALSDTSPGVKELSLEEMKQVKGGYVVEFEFFKDRRNLTSEVYAIAEITLEERKNLDKGLCGAGEDKCQNPSRDRLFAWLQASANSPADYRPVYKVKRQIKYSNLGQPYVLFTYGVAVYNVNNGQIYQYNSSPMLNNNRIIREIAHQYKSVIEDAMGGWNPRLF